MYLHRSAIEPLTYGWYRDQQAWHFVVNIPSWAGVAERQELARWLDSYAKTIRKERPLWVVQVKPNGNRFVLDAYPSRNEAELLENLFRLAQENTYAA